MKIKVYTFILIASLFFISSELMATNGMRLIGFGPVQRSMGGVSVGLGLDAASLLTNPANMEELGGRIDFGASYFDPSPEYSATGPMPGIITNDGTAIKSDRGPSPVPALGLIIPIDSNLHFGLGAYGISGMGVDYEKNLYNNVTYTSYSQMRFAPGLSFKVNDMISIGLTANIMYATMEFNAGFNPSDPNFGVLNGAGMGDNSQQPHMGAASYGYGATVGLTLKPVNNITVGASYETKSVFQDFEFNTYYGKEKIEFNQPSSATIGLGISPIQGLSLGVDVQWIRWSETNGKDLPEYSENVRSVPWNLNWEDQVVYKAGIQFIISPLLTLRAGYNYGKMPLDKDRAFENIAFPAVSEQHYTAGVGLNFSEKFTLNISGMYSPEASIKGSNNNQYIASYETKMSQYSLDVGLGYKY